jgi:hypothetical protein
MWTNQQFNNHKNSHVHRLKRPQEQYKDLLETNTKFLTPLSPSVKKKCEYSWISGVKKFNMFVLVVRIISVFCSV